MKAAALAAPFVGFALAASLSAQQVWIVGPNPGPSSSPALGTALAAAADGDVILVRQGYYNAFTTGTKSLSIVADVGPAPIVFSFTFSGQAAGKSLFVRGIDFRPASFPTPNSGVNVKNCAGSVRFEGCTFAYSLFATAAGPLLNIDACASVTLARCSVAAMVGTTDINPGIVATNSMVTLFDTTVTGGSGYPNAISEPANPPTTPGSAGMVLSGGILFASGSTFQGGAGGGDLPPIQAGPGSVGGNGLEIGGAAILQGCTFAGGAGGNGSTGFAPNGLPTVLLAGGSLMPLGGAPHHFRIDSPIREGQVATLTAGGPPGEMAAYLVSPLPELSTFLPGLNGVLTVSFLAVDAVLIGQISAGGSAVLNATIPSLPASVQGRTFYLQSFFFDTALTYAVLGPHSDLTILDSSL